MAWVRGDWELVGDSQAELELQHEVDEVWAVGEAHRE